MEVKQVSNTELGNYLERKKNNYKIVEFYRELELDKKDDIAIMAYNREIERILPAAGFYITDLNEFVARKPDIVKITKNMSDLEQLDFWNADRPTKAFQIASCMNWWDTNIYHQNKKIELLRTFRCKDKFCTNCKRVRVSELLTQFMEQFAELSKKYSPMLLTLTVPNVTGDKLRDEIGKMFERYSLYQKLFSAKLTDKRSHKKRQYDVAGAIRALEVTYNKHTNEYHPHLHILIFVDDRAPSEFWAKNITGEWCDRKRQHNMISAADEEIRALWTKLYKDIDRRKETARNENYICDVRPVNGVEGILEVLKYSFKTRDILNFDVFCNLRSALHGRRLKQGYGCLYNMKFEDAELPDLSENLFDELPESLTVNMRKLITDFGEYDKVKRFRKMDFFQLIDKYLDD